MGPECDLDDIGRSLKHLFQARIIRRYVCVGNVMNAHLSFLT